MDIGTTGTPHWRARAFGCATTPAVNVLAAEAAPENPCPACAKTAQDKGDHRGSASECHFAEIRSSRIQDSRLKYWASSWGPLGCRKMGKQRAGCHRETSAILATLQRGAAGKIHAEIRYATSGNRRPGNLTSARRSTGQGLLFQSLRCWPRLGSAPGGSRAAPRPPAST